MDGFFDKVISLNQLIDELSKIVYDNHRYFEDWREEYIPLTKREQQILQLISNGDIQSKIANQLGISERTVRNHVAAINKKLGTTSALESCIRGIELGLVDIET